MTEAAAPARPRPLTIALRSCDVAIALLLVSVLANTINHAMVYRVDMKLMEYHFQALTLLMVVRILSCVPWREVIALPRLQQLYLGAAALVFGFFLRNLLIVNFPEAIKAVVVTRMAFDGSSDEEIGEEITRWNKWYPRASFVEDARKTIPESDTEGILYIGDQRAHIMSYLMYPRRIYVLPRLQVLQNKAVEDNWTWTPMEDPMFPAGDPLNPPDPVQPGAPDAEVQRETLALIHEKKIGWVMYYDSINPDRSFVSRIPSTE